MKKIWAVFFFTVNILAVSFTNVAFAAAICDGWEYYDYNSNSCVPCQDSGFTITTTDLPANTKFWFSLSASGDFAVDWGDKIQNINRDNTNSESYTYTYATGGVKNIKFCGRATNYNSNTGDNVVAAISFYNNTTNGSHTKIKSVSGMLGAVFPTLGNGETPNQQPRFRSTFQGANSLTEIPANLFQGVFGSADGMFRSTFDKCSALQSIPYGLFANATGGAQNMFRSTFYQCTGLTSLPDDLFAGINMAENNEFMYTLYGTNGLKNVYIPPSTFAGLIKAGSPQNPTMWNQTFDTSVLVTKCPARTQQYITGYEGSTPKSSWNGRVSCKPNNPCTGANYWDPTNEVCVPCPTGYNYDKNDTKASITECKIQCEAGTYLATIGDATCTNAGIGYYATGGVINYGSTSAHTKCPDNMPTVNNIANASNASQCVVYCRGTNYRDTTNNACVACPSGYDDDKTNGKKSITECKIHCDAGTHLASPHAPSCTNVGDGFYAAENTVAYGEVSWATACPDGQMTGTLNASDESQCIELCSGATYYDSTTDRCLSCPVGYNAHTISGKKSAEDCQIHCVAGTYIKNAYDTVCTNVGDGFYVASSYVNYGDIGTRNSCPKGQMTGTQTATDLSQCQTSCEGATYFNSTSGQCTDCPDGYRDNITNGKNSINQCQHFCSGGSYAEIYTPILYLQSDGTKQFIDTKYEIKKTHIYGTAVVGTATTLSGTGSDSGNFFGNLYGPGGFSTNFKGGNFGLWIQSPGKGEKAKFPGDGSGVFVANQQYTINYDVLMGTGNATAQIRVDDNPQKSLTLAKVAINAEGNSFKLFTNGGAVKNGNTVSGSNWGDKLFTGRIYSLQMYEDDKLVLDLIPVRRESDGELGMFNRVTNEFYGNSGLNDFTPGADSGTPFIMCTAVGNGYYAAENYTNFGETGTRNRCPNGSPTMENDTVINNAYSIYQCDGVEPCYDATYPDPNTGICTECPSGYDFNTQNKKESIYECQTHCYAGTYLANKNDPTCTYAGNGYYATEATINWDDIGVRFRCPNGGPTDKEDATDESECKEIVNTCTGATYMNVGACVPCPDGYDDNESAGKNSATDCQLICPEGTYIPDPNSTTCVDAGAGFWATGGAVNYGSTSSRIACAPGLTTVGYGHGADELADCGRVLHIGDYVLYTKTTKPTTPAINIRPENGPVHYIGVSPTKHTLSSLHVTLGNQLYTAFDDCILHGERDFKTNTRIIK